MLSNGEWLVRLAGLPGNTRQEQQAAAQTLVSRAGLHDVQVVDHVGADGMVLIHTPLQADPGRLTQELQSLPGFQYVEPYDPAADPSTRRSQFPTPRRKERSLTRQAPNSHSPGNPLGGGPGDAQPLQGFEGIASPESSCFIFDVGCSPPDTIGAPGPDSYIETVNDAIALYDKATGAPIAGPQSLDSFLTPLHPSSFIGDPVIIYDEFAQKFVAGVTDVDHSRWMMAISKTSNPPDFNSANWDFFSFSTLDPTQTEADFPKIGYNRDGYVITFNMFQSLFFDHVSILAIPRSNPANGTFTVVPGGFSNFTLAPATMHTSAANDPMWFVQDGHQGQHGNFIQVVQMTNVYTPTPSFTTTSISVDPFGDAPNPRQPGGSLGQLTSLGTRFYFSALRNVGNQTRLVAGHTVGSGGGARVRWYEFNVGGPVPVLTQQGEINQGPNVDTFFPSIDIAPSGAIGMTFLQTSTTAPDGFLSMYVTGRKPSDAPGTMQTPTLAKQGTNFLDGKDRAGDYSFTAIDPVDGTFWSANEWAGPGVRPNWHTWIEHFVIGFAVTASTPAIGEILTTAPISFAVSFSEPADPATVTPAQLQVNGVHADTITLSTDHLTATFGYAVSPVTAEGLQTMAIAEGAIQSEAIDEPIAPFTAHFRYANPRLQVTSTEPANGAVVALPFTSLVVHFNRPFAPETVGTSNVNLSDGTVTAATVVDATTVRYTLAGINDEQRLTVNLATGPLTTNVLTDLFGTPMAGFTGNLTLNLDTIALPSPTPVAPPGSLVYQTTYPFRATIDPVGDTDRFTVSVNAGQTLTVVVHPTDTLPGQTLRPTIQLLDPANAVIGTATSPAPGVDALLQTVATTTTGTYTVTVGGADATTGGFTVQVWLNSAVAAKDHGGPPNDTRATAQDLDPAFVALPHNSARAAVLATTGGGEAAFVAAAVPFTFEDISATGHGTLQGMHDATVQLTAADLDGFVFPFLGQTYDTLWVSSNGLITFGSSNASRANSPLTTFPSQAVIAPLWQGYTIGSATFGGGVFWEVRGSGANRRLIVEWRHAAYSSIAIGNTFEAVLNMADGSIQFNYQDLRGGDGNRDEGRLSTVGVKDAGTQGRDRLLLAFQDRGHTTPLVGTGKSVLLTVPPPLPSDFYSFNLAGGQSTTLALKALNRGNLVLELQDGAGTVLATGQPGATNLDQVINRFVAPATGTYYVRVTGASIANGNQDYNLVVTRAADVSTHPHDTFANAQDVTGQAGVLGALGFPAYHASAVPFAFEDISTTGHAILDGAHDDTVQLTAADLGGFVFPFFGQTYDTLWISSNGLITFGSSNTSHTNTNLTTFPTQAAIAPLWFEYEIGSEPTLSAVLWDVRGTGDNRRLVVEWKGIAFIFGDPHITFEAVLNMADGSIQFNYQTLQGISPFEPDNRNFNDGRRGTVGLKDAGTQGLNRLLLSFDSGPNEFVGEGQSTRIDLSNPEDWYRVTAAVGQTLTVDTSTPSNGSDAFHNILNPHLELYDPNNVLVATGVKQADGRNEVLTYVVADGAAGDYRIRIVSTNGTQGEYLLGAVVGDAGGGAGGSANGAGPTSAARSAALDALFAGARPDSVNPITGGQQPAAAVVDAASRPSTVGVVDAAFASSLPEAVTVPTGPQAWAAAGILTHLHKEDRATAVDAGLVDPLAEVL
jgi:hypothetical protein